MATGPKRWWQFWRRSEPAPQTRPMPVSPSLFSDDAFAFPPPVPAQSGFTQPMTRLVAGPPPDEPRTGWTRPMTRLIAVGSVPPQRTGHTRPMDYPIEDPNVGKRPVTGNYGEVRRVHFGPTTKLEIYDEEEVDTGAMTIPRPIRRR